MENETIKIRGMGCDHCVTAVRSALEALDGVDVEAVEIGSARVRIDPDAASRSTIDEAIREAGYEPETHIRAGE